MVGAKVRWMAIAGLMAVLVVLWWVAVFNWLLPPSSPQRLLHDVRLQQGWISSTRGLSWSEAVYDLSGGQALPACEAAATRSCSVLVVPLQGTVHFRWVFR